jgi:hypothetical protein
MTGACGPYNLGGSATGGDLTATPKEEEAAARAMPEEEEAAPLVPPTAARLTSA